MPEVYLASSLAQYADGDRFVVLAGSTIEEVLCGLRDRYPGFRQRVVDADGQPRPHISIFLNSTHVLLKSGLRTSVGDRDEIAILSAIAGG